MFKLHKNITIEDIIEAVESDEYDGFCLSCGQHIYGGIEPDARNYECPHCEKNEVYGASELLIMFG